MRKVRYRDGRGRPNDTARFNLNELLLILEAAVTLAYVERWVQRAVENNGRRSSSFTLTHIPGKKDPYEVSVVDSFIRLGAVSFAAHGSIARWERSFPNGKRGPNQRVDLCLINPGRTEESRIEFGTFSKSKLQADSSKLHRLNAQPSNFEDGTTLTTSNYVMLWQVNNRDGVGVTDNAWLDTCSKAAKSATSNTKQVTLRACSEQDLFVDAVDKGRAKVQTVIYEVH